MVQSYTGYTVTALVKMKLKELFKKYGYTLIFGIYLKRKRIKRIN